jgi:hypothetical protein
VSDLAHADNLVPAMCMHNVIFMFDGKSVLGASYTVFQPAVDMKIPAVLYLIEYIKWAALFLVNSKLLLAFTTPRYSYCNSKL